jgi:SNF2 family DNA or RNA helicase
VIAPSGVERNWDSDELPKHLPDRIQYRVLVWQTSKANTQRHSLAAKCLLREKEFPWLLMSYDAIMTTKGKDFLWRFLQDRRCLLVADESDAIKSPGAKRTKRLLAASAYASYKIGLTGTPVTQGPFDIYPQVKFVDEVFWKNNGFADYMSFKTYFGEWFTRADCMELHGYDPKYDKLMGYRNLDKLQELLKGISSRVLKDDVLDLPPKVYKTIYFELTPEQNRLYDQLQENFEVETLSGKQVTAGLAIVRLLRFQQICSGYVGTDDEDTPMDLIPGPNPLLEALDDWASHLSGKAIVWCRFTADIELVTERLTRHGRVVKYYGPQSDDENFAASEAFKRDPDVAFIVANSQKGATGLTWNMARHVAYYSNSFRLRDRLQSEDRAHRAGLAHSVDYTDFIALRPDGRRTVMKHIVENLRKKRDIASQITGDELKEWI